MRCENSIHIFQEEKKKKKKEMTKEKTKHKPQVNATAYLLN